jgi:hypothetical protein
MKATCLSFLKTSAVGAAGAPLDEAISSPVLEKELFPGLSLEVVC